ncbi:MAG: radical SAM protein [Methanomicrobiales archaeon]|nr:radical SAM protein [Methanomicrobiales archaeon]
MTLFPITRDTGIPLVGSVAFGIIDRGTSLLQVRPSSSCNLDCPFCSVDAGPCSRTRVTGYRVERGYLVDCVREAVAFKGGGVECHIDSPGEPLIYPEIAPLVADLRSIPGVSVISMQSNGTLLTPDRIRALEEAGLDRINLSLHALDPDMARTLAGVDWYDVEKVAAMARAVAGSRMDLLVAPVYIPGINDAEIPKLIRFAREIGAGKQWPPLGIQKFERYRMGRTPPGVSPQSWNQFYRRSLAVWEAESGMHLRITPEDFGTERRPQFPRPFRKGEKVTLVIRGPGWLSGEKIAVGRGRSVSVLDCRRGSGTVRARIVSAAHNIFIAVPV